MKEIQTATAPESRAMTSDRIRRINDDLRRYFASAPDRVPGPFQILITPGAGALAPEAFAELIGKVEAFDAFTADNDPHDEHDFGAVEVAGSRFFWKIDYYDLALRHHSPDASNPALTRRVLTIMRADEY
jgi:hypothetical protein